MPRSRSSDTIKSSQARKDVDDPSILIQNFDKPTQIYRYLKTRLIKLPPLFLHRNLTYMKGRSTRKNGTKRKDVKLDDLLEKVKSKDKEPLPTNENLIIAFVRFDDALLSSSTVKVETKLEKISHKRRKEGIVETHPKQIGQPVTVSVNTDSNGTNMLPAVCVTNNEFESNGENVNTYQLSFDIEAQPIRSKADADEPPNKHQCLRKKYHAELPVFDKSGRNLLLNGLYQVSALEPHVHRPLSGARYWETLDSDKRIQNWMEEVNKHFKAEDDSNPFTNFDKTPKIQLYMEWKRETVINYIQRPEFINEPQLNNNKENSSINVPHENGNYGFQYKVEAVLAEPEETTRYAYQFVMNNSKQRFEERTDFNCPWCSLNCIRMYSLMKHLKLCHSRFLFQLVNESPVQRIDVYVNELYDGSYSGAPHDVLLGSQRGPTRRTVVTCIMVFHPRRPTYNLVEFQEADDGELDQQRQYISGHNRIYYHSETCIPIMPKELDYDSEGEPDPKWLQRTTKQMIDEFTDVNNGEKELMKMWNLHVMKHGFVGDVQIKLACNLFLKEKGHELVQKNLMRNFVNHLHSLFNYGLISPKEIYDGIKRLEEIQKEVHDSESWRDNRQLSIANWEQRNEAERKNDPKPASPSKTASKSIAKSASMGSKPTTKVHPKSVEIKEKSRKRSLQ